MNELRRRPGRALASRNQPCFRMLRSFFTDRSSGKYHRDSYDYSKLLGHCRTIRSVQELHAQVIVEGQDQNEFLATKLIGKYVEHGESKMGIARKVFDRLLQRDVFAWNVVIQGYASSGPFVEALNLFDEMRVCGAPTNRYTFPFVLKACGAMKNIEKGKIVHGHVLKSGLDLDLFVGNALIAFYAKCQDVETARKVFDEMSLRDIVSWNSMIAGYTLNGKVDDAIMLFHAMLHDQAQAACSPDHATLVGILPACVTKSASQVGFWVHSYVIKTGMVVGAPLGSCLISMYGNCGHVNIARDVFDRIDNKNIIVWSAIIRCYGMHGFANEALNMFTRLEEVGLKPDGVIFLNLLSTCSHTGLVAKGREIYEKMEAYGVERKEEHYACMVDLLGRAGFLEQAVEFVEGMPVQAGKDVYGALLGACRIHNNLELAKEIGEKLFVLDPENAGRYVILASMYEDAGQWEDAAKLRKLLRDRNIRKPVGCSSIEVDRINHVFGKEDENHPFTEQIFDTLEKLERIMEVDFEPI